MNPFELRLEVLKMAKDMVTEDYYSKRQIIDNNYNQLAENHRSCGTPVPNHPGYPIFPSEDEIKKKAIALYEFVQMSQPTETKKKS